MNVCHCALCALTMGEDLMCKIKKGYRLIKDVRM